MSKYYYLIAGLPNLLLEDGKPPFSVSGFKEELNSYLTVTDKKLHDLFFLKFDNKNLLNQLRHPDYDPDLKGNITQDEFGELFNELKNAEEENSSGTKNKRIPAYIAEFVRLYLETEAKEERSAISWEDRLATLYYAYAVACSNRFVAAWFALNLNINNVLAAITCRKYGLDRSNYIVGDSEIANHLRTSNARDFELGDSLEYLPDVLRIAEETDLLLREKKIDQLKWEWLDDNTFSRVFDIESVLAYLLKLELLERWATLDKATGEKTFRGLVGAMKKGSDNALEEFKRNNKK
ncbi:MAG: DUF2764 domain-containing protein [Tannerella sp.]|jgi:hypothetical protein|nr:DUF2764 domain-containing protein [Tannerella sp.]